MTTKQAHPDWLVAPVTTPATATVSADGSTLALSNGLACRRIRLAPNAATIELANLTTGETLLRGVKPEAELTLDGVSYAIGGLDGQPDYGYLDPVWIERLTANPAAFQFVGYTTGPTRERFPWGKRRPGAETAPWPPPGIEVTMAYRAPASAPHLAGLAVEVHYDLYQGLPLMAKWVGLHNDTPRTVRLDNVTPEILAAVEAESHVDLPAEWRKPLLHVESDYQFHGGGPVTANQTVQWLPDPQYESQVCYSRQAPLMLVSRYPHGVGIALAPGQTFESFRTWTLLFDDWDRERQGLAIRRMYRTLAPWIQENPIYFHLVGSDSEAIRRAADQCADVGFDMLIVSFWQPVHTDGAKGEAQEGPFSMQNDNPAFLQRVRADFDYAHAKGVEVGSYTLTSSADAGPDWNVIHPVTGRPDGAIFGQAPCLASEWADTYYGRIRSFIGATGLDCIEDDGSYPGDRCASTTHAHHAGVADSQYRQWERIAAFYRACRARGIYLNVPDWYLLQGTSKICMGYRESNFSLPRPIQILHARQNIYDGTWEKPPSAGWMFVPLTAYHANNPEAVFEPLEEHLEELEWHLAQNFGCGVMACYRGRRLYDTERTRAVLARWVAFCKRYRDILNSDLIHVRRPDGGSVDCLMHVNAGLPHRGLAMVFNPTAGALETRLTLPLYYTGLTDRALVREQEGPPVLFTLDREYRIELSVRLAARRFTWFVLDAP